MIAWQVSVSVDGSPPRIVGEIDKAVSSIWKKKRGAYEEMKHVGGVVSSRKKMAENTIGWERKSKETGGRSSLVRASITKKIGSQVDGCMAGLMPQGACCILTCTFER